MSGPSLETCVQHLESVALNVLELLAFNAQTGLTDQSTVHRQTHTQTDTWTNPMKT